MGDVIISALVKLVLERLITCKDIQEYDLLWRFKDEILTIKDQFERIKPFIHDAEEKRSRNEEVDLWLKTLGFVIKNVLDGVLTEAMSQSLFIERGNKSSVRTFFSTDCFQFMFHRRIAHTLKDIRSKLDDIESQISKLSLASNDTIHVDLNFDQGNMPHKKTSSIFGRDNDLKIVKEKICNKNTGKNESGKIRVYGIWGIEGMGKTTLAELVFKHEKVNKDFKFKYWVNVEKITKVDEIMIKIIKEIDNGPYELTHLDGLQSYLQMKLKGKEFLMVLDDICIEDDVLWNILCDTLSHGTAGSIVMMTTRSKKTLDVMAKDPVLQHELGPLSEEASWLLFKRVAFEGRETDDIRELEPIGWKIVENCERVPLIVNNIALLMQSKKSKYEWMNVMKNSGKDQSGLSGTKILQKDITSEKKNDVALKDLESTYNSLLPYFQICFAYCYLFPKGYNIEKDEAIQLWVVNNFIPQKGEKDAYEAGKKIFDYLIQKSLFQVVKDKKYSNYRFKVHDLMHDMAKEVMGNKFFVIPPEINKEDIEKEKVIHLSSSCPSFPCNYQDLKQLWSIFIFEKINEGYISKFFNDSCIRVLYLCGIELKKLPDSICQLKNLIYLNLSHSSIKVLPDRIVNLQNMQMLLLKFCYELYELPEGLKYMKSLRLLDITSCHSLRCLPSGIKEITNIRRLPRFHVGKNVDKNAGEKQGAKLEELGSLNQLEGELEISGLENVGGLDEAKSANLKDKRNVSNLKLSWSNIDMRESDRDDQKVLNGLKPCSSLEKLYICFYMGKSFSTDWMPKLKNLVEIVFSVCSECKDIPPLAALPKLRVIKLLGMNSLERFHESDLKKETDIFVCLQELHIFLCPSLAYLPSKLPKLQFLKLVECGSLTSLPYEILKGLKELEISRCKNLSKRYENKKSADWSKFPNLSKIIIDDSVMYEDEDEDDNEV